MANPRSDTEIPTVTDFQRRALQVIHEAGGEITPTEFAERMWPDSPAWQKVYAAGPYGSARGLALVRSAGGHLGRLTQRGWLYRKSEASAALYCLTSSGQALLENA